MLALTYNRLYIFIFCLLVFAGLFFVLKHTRLGLQVRAVSQNRGMARAMGVRSARVDALTFGLGSGIAVNGSWANDTYDVYVNDAFGTAHRAHASTAGVAGSPSHGSVEIVDHRALVTCDSDQRAVALPPPRVRSGRGG